ncbi:hypothetical protein HCJ96_11750 [Alteromonas sp. MYP5]|uniref:Uncharacterized protein n=2 Tax=Alteromonas ponticola TaxID=2720613 RepID=A0ABX1R625_9ALTE|nr:DUF6702 family protein [Alteromonas ponticola]NMH60700.1 hypothetical protein [Alteromonas ponticola]
MTTGIASAHQIKAAISTVLFNPRTENIEIMHRFNLHDAEHAVKTLFDKQSDILKDAQTQQRFAEYAAQRFSLFDSKDQSLALKLVGFEVEGKHFWVYQETEQPPSLEGLRVRHDALRDLWPAQINTINVEGKGELQTLEFRDNVELLKVSFEQAH